MTGPAPETGKAQPDYTRLPDRVRPEDMSTENPAREPGDPTLGGRDAERDWMLRNAG